MLPDLFHLSKVGDISVLNLHFRTGAIFKGLVIGAQRLMIIIKRLDWELSTYASWLELDLYFIRVRTLVKNLKS